MKPDINNQTADQLRQVTTPADVKVRDVVNELLTLHGLPTRIGQKRWQQRMDAVPTRTRRRGKLVP